MRRDVFQAIADPTRRTIIVLLSLQALTPNAIAGHFGLTRQAVSKHLRILSECELVEGKHTGREILYSLQFEKIKSINIWLDQVQQNWDTRYNQLDYLLESMKEGNT